MDNTVELWQEPGGKYTLIINGIRCDNLNREDVDILLRRWEREQIKKGGA